MLRSGVMVLRGARVSEHDGGAWDATGPAVLLMICGARLGTLGGPLSRGRRVFRNGTPVLLCARVRGPSGSFTWPVTTGGVMHWVGCEGYRTCIAAWAGVRVAHSEPAGFVRRLAIGEPGGAISVGGRAEAGGALVRMGEEPPLLRALLPPLPSRYRPPPRV